MTTMVRHFVLLLFALAISSATANANTITLNYDFSASGFGIGAPVDPVTGSFSVTFDDTVIDTVETSGIVVSNLNIALDSAPSFSYHQPGDVLYIGGSANGIFGFPAGTNDFAMAIGGASTPSPNLFVFAYSTSLPESTFGPVVESLVLTPTVPEPATITLFGLGLTGAGLRRWRRHKS